MVVMGKIQQNFQVDQVVTIERTNDPELDGQRVTILGKSAAHPLCDFYIVLLEKPYSKNGYKAITMIETCLDQLSNGGPK